MQVMGLFSARRRLPRLSDIRPSIRVHSEVSISGAAVGLAGRVCRRLATIAARAANDARVVAAFFVIAVVALAFAMALSLGLL
jgi:hypothetical protein